MSLPRRALLALAIALALATALTGRSLAGVGKPRLVTPEAPTPSGVEVPPDDATTLGSCSMKGGTCVDYQGAFAGIDLRSRCEKGKGVWSSQPCPIQDRVGSCTQREVGKDDRTITRSFRPVTAKAAHAECKKVPRAVFLAR